MMIHALVLTSWVTGKDNHPKFADEHPGIGWQDVTGQPVKNIMPDPNLYVIELPACPDKDFDLIDPDLVLMSEEVKDAAVIRTGTA